MTVNPDVAGRTYPATATYDVGREKIREFAEAIGSTNPLHFDQEAARQAGHPDVIAPPTFAVLIAQRASARVVQDPDVGIDFTRVVHGEQQFTHHRPICAGDSLATSTTIDSIRVVAGNSMVTISDHISDRAGQPVCTATSMLVVRAEEQK